MLDGERIMSGLLRYTVTQTREIQVWAESPAEAASIAEAALEYGVKRGENDHIVLQWSPPSLEGTTASLIEKPVVTRLTTRLD